MTQDESKTRAKNKWFFDFSYHPTVEVQFFTVRNMVFERGPGSPEMEHELWLATHQQRAGGQDEVSLHKLPQINKCEGKL